MLVIEYKNDTILRTCGFGEHKDKPCQLAELTNAHCDLTLMTHGSGSFSRATPDLCASNMRPHCSWI